MEAEVDRQLLSLTDPPHYAGTVRLAWASSSYQALRAWAGHTFSSTPSESVCMGLIVQPRGDTGALSNPFLIGGH
jgi:hypothetical protein